MPNLDTESAFENMKSRLVEALRAQFPFEGAKRRLELVEVKFDERSATPDDVHHTDNIEAQFKAKLAGSTWGVPVRARLRLVDKATGHLVEESTVTLARLPKLTRRYSFIVGGEERQHDSVFRLKSRPYHYIANDGAQTLTAQWNLAAPATGGFDLEYNPKTGKMVMRVGSSHICLYTVLRVLGVDDGAIRDVWGRDLFDVNQKASREKADVDKLFAALHLRLPDRSTEGTVAQKAQRIREYFAHETEVRPDEMKVALGVAAPNVNGAGLLASSVRLVDIQRGRTKDDPLPKELPDDRQALSAKYLATTEDFLAEAIAQADAELRRKVSDSIDKPDKRIDDILSPNTYNKIILGKFERAQRPDQTNPLQFLSGYTRTTVRGKDFGGVSSERINLDADKQINPTHLGFLDAIQTPECWPGHAEVFTARGWVRWDDVRDDERFLCQTSNTVGFWPASKVHRSKYSGELYCMDQGKIAYAVTPNHRMWVSTSWAPESWRFAEARTVHGKGRRFDTGHAPAEWPKITELAYFVLPPVEGNNSSKNVKEPIPMADWAEFIGWYLSEGSFYYREAGADSRYNVRIHQAKSANPAEYERIRALMDRLPFNWHWDGEDKVFSISTKQLAHYVQQFGKAQDKYIPEYFFETPVEAREALLEALLLGDGRVNCVREDGRTYEQHVYTTSSPQLARDVERLAATLGCATTTARYEDRREERYLDIYEVRLLHHRYRTSHPAHPNYPTKFWREQFEGTVYCATVPGSKLYCRMPGRVAFWSGNSEDTGIALHLPLGISVSRANVAAGSRSKASTGQDVRTRVYDVRLGEMVMATPADLEHAVVAYPDQVTWRDGKPFPVADTVVCYDEERRTTKRPWARVRYVLPSSKALFGFSANLIPFLQNDSGNRSMTAAKQQEQAVSLVHAEAPLVQVKTDGAATFENLLGSFNAHFSPVSGTVAKVEPGAVHVSSGGKTTRVQTYDHFPLNGGKGMLHATPTVSPGQAVKKGDLLADTNFTRGGVLSMGTNLRVAYLPWRGLNFEDGVVVSESAAKKLASSHMHQETVSIYHGMIGAEAGARTRWRYHAQSSATAAQLGKLDDRGIVQEGQTVVEGDILVCVLSPAVRTPEDAIAARIDKSLVSPYKDSSLRWDHEYPGKVVRVSVTEGLGRKTVTVHITTEEPLVVGDKLSGRHGNKGIVSRIVRDHEMPHTADGAPADILLNPAGVPSRMNVGTVLETAAGKIADKTGKPYVVENFSPGVDYADKVKKDLAQHGLTDTEEMFDPETGRSVGQVLIGKQYILKLHHEVEKKMTARSFGGGYTTSGEPPKGRGVPGGGQKIDTLTTYALLAHGAKNNLREAYSFKSDGDQDAVWAAVATGRPLPPPQPTRGMKNFLDYLRAMGINTQKNGDFYTISPMTDAHLVGDKARGIVGISNGEIRLPDKATRAKVSRGGASLTLEERGGLFDPHVTGGLKGTSWSHIKLAERMPNPLFESAIQTLTGLSTKEYARLTGPSPVDGKNGFKVIEEKLSQIDVDRELAKERAALPTRKRTDLSRSTKRIRYLEALKASGFTPLEAYTNSYLPVLPPMLHRLSPGLDGTQAVDDRNGLYLAVGYANGSLKTHHASMPLEDLQKARAHLYSTISALKLEGMTQRAGKPRHLQGLMELLTGKTDGEGQPKDSYFQSSVLARRQNLSGRSTIVPEPALHLDEVGVPIPIALEMYHPFVVRELVRAGYAPAAANKLVTTDKNSPQVMSALGAAVSRRPVLLKRDPSLHKFSILAFHPKLVSGSAIQIHPLVTGGFNADFDGDNMSLYVPVSEAAVDEAHALLPSANLFSPTHFGLMTIPGQDSLLGIYQATKWGSEVNVPGLTADVAVKMMQDGKLKPTDVVTVNGRKTTPGRLTLASHLPTDMQQHETLLYNSSFTLNKSTLSDLLMQVAKKHATEFPHVVDAWKDLGNRLSYLNGSSFSIDDFHDGKRFRDRVLAPYKAREAELHATPMSGTKRDQELVKLYTDARKELKQLGEARYNASDNRVWEWAKAKARGNWDQFSQLVLGPMLVQDSRKKDVPVPITRSYGEGLSVSEYWASLHGARKGTLDRVQGTRDPGAVTKDIMNTVMGMTVTAEDCGATQGVTLSLRDPDAVDRYLAKAVTVGKDDVPAGTLLTSALVTKLGNEGVREVTLRSPLFCRMSNGICAKCFGLNERGRHHAVGTNIGILAGHALGEPITQLTMKSFHSGGASGSAGSTAVDSFGRVLQLFKLPEELPASAILSEVDGVVEHVSTDPRTRVVTVTVAGHDHKVVTGKVLEFVRVGAHVHRGDALSTGPINPNELLRLTKSMPKVRDYIVGELMHDDIYGKLGVRRRNVETVVKGMTNLTEITHAPEGSPFLRGEYAPLSEVNEHNEVAKTEGRELVSHSPKLRAMTQLPLAGVEDWLARLNYQRLADTYTEGAAQGWKSDIRGPHPIPGLAHGAEFGLHPPKTVPLPPAARREV